MYAGESEGRRGSGGRAAPHLSLPHAGGGREVAGGHAAPRVTPSRRPHCLAAHSHLLFVPPRDAAWGCGEPGAGRGGAGRGGGRRLEEAKGDRA